MPFPTIAAPRCSDRDYLLHLSSLSRERRLADYRAGLFSRRQLSLWANHYHDEVPKVNGELEWIALRLADLD
jgi:hypothetical protein